MRFLLPPTPERSACNDLTYTPEEIVMNLYGYTCGDGDFAERCSDAYNGKYIHNLASAGFCKYGSRKHGYLLDDQIDQRFVGLEHFVSCCLICC